MNKLALAVLLMVVSSWSVAQNGWVAEALTTFTQRLGADAAFKQSGPQSIFYVDELPEGSEADALEALERYRSRVAPPGNLVIVGLRPELAYIANANKPAERLTNTSLVATYASLIDGRDRRIGEVSGQGFTGCVASRTATSSTIRCGNGQSVTQQTTCQLYGGDVVCRSDD